MKQWFWDHMPYVVLVATLIGYLLHMLQEAMIEEVQGRKERKRYTEYELSRQEFESWSDVDETAFTDKEQTEVNRILGGLKDETVTFAKARPDAANHLQIKPSPMRYIKPSPILEEYVSGSAQVGITRVRVIESPVPVSPAPGVFQATVARQGGRHTAVEGRHELSPAMAAKPHAWLTPTQEWDAVTVNLSYLSPTKRKELVSA